jgi:hypothetical protein
MRLRPAEEEQMRMLQGSHAIAGSDALTIDGRIVHIRPVTEGDAVALTALYGRGSPASLRIRFLVPSPSAIAADRSRVEAGSTSG